MFRPITIEYLDEICQEFNQQDVDAILSHFATDCVWLMARGPNSPEGRRCVGKEEIGTVLRTRYVEIPDADGKRCAIGYVTRPRLCRSGW